MKRFYVGTQNAMCLAKELDTALADAAERLKNDPKLDKVYVVEVVKVVKRAEMPIIIEDLRDAENA